MKRLFYLLFTLLITTAFVSGCGKMSTVDVYKYAVNVDMGTTYEDVEDDLGKKGRVTYSNALEQFCKWEIEDAILLMHFNREDEELVLDSVKISNRALIRVVVENDCAIKKMPDDIYDKIHNGQSYDYVKEVMGLDGIVAGRSTTTTEYVWLDKTGEGFQAIFGTDGALVKYHLFDAINSEDRLY